MEYIEIKSFDDFRVNQIFNCYCESFPEDERRNEKQFRFLFNHPKVKIFSILSELKEVGYLISWELTDALFIEHFEVFSEFRNRNYGSEILSELTKIYPHIVLETEPENLNETAQRRVGFYKKNGFAVIDETYVQPPYEQGKNSLNLWLFANFIPEKISRLKEEIFDVVYC